MYQELYDENHKIIRTSTKEPKIISKQPTGEYDGNILCAECDNIKIGQLEDYASKVLYSGNLSKNNLLKISAFPNPGGTAHTLVENLLYSEFKLFLLSILWRASISSRDYFNKVQLGPYEEEIRLMILKKDAKEPENFPCILVNLRNELEWTKGLHLQAIRNKDKSGSYYPFLISGTIYVFYVPDYFGPRELKGFYINKSNEIYIVNTPPGQGKVLMNLFFGIRP